MENSQRDLDVRTDPRVGAILVALVDIDPEFDEELNEWYDNTHVPELVRCDGFLSGRRGVALDPSQSPGYIAIYELEDARQWIWRRLKLVRAGGHLRIG